MAFKEIFFMPRQKSPEPRTFIEEGGRYPFGPFKPETPAYALAAAVFSANLMGYMDGALEIEGEGIDPFIRESQATLSKKAEISQAVLSRIMTGAAYPDLNSIARLEEYVGLQLWGKLSDRKLVLAGSYRPTARRG
jgi:hypothetical protein